MTPPVGYKILSAAGLVLMGVMFILLRVGTTSESTFYMWIVLMLVGLGALVLGRKLDSDARARLVQADLQRRQALPREPGGV